MTESTRKAWLAIRGLLWMLALPGFFAGFVPWRYFGLRDTVFDISNAAHVVGALAIAAGVLLLALCVFEFGRTGRGTLSPADPPKVLVVRGLYRHVRNPMYLSVTVIVLGELLLTRSVGLLTYWVVWFVAANVFVMAYEEPYLRRQFGAAYEHYAAAVGRWIPRLRPYQAAR